MKNNLIRRIFALYYEDAQNHCSLSRFGFGDFGCVSGKEDPPARYTEAFCASAAAVQDAAALHSRSALREVADSGCGESAEWEQNKAVNLPVVERREAPPLSNEQPVCHACRQPMAWWEDWFWHSEAWCKRCEYIFVVHKYCARHRNLSGLGACECAA